MKTENNLIVGIDCNCYTEGYAHQSITLCPLHAAAPELLEACKAGLAVIKENRNLSETAGRLRAAIAKAEWK